MFQTTRRLLVSCQPESKLVVAVASQRNKRAVCSYAAHVHIYMYIYIYAYVYTHSLYIRVFL